MKVQKKSLSFSGLSLRAIYLIASKMTQTLFPALRSWVRSPRQGRQSWTPFSFQCCSPFSRKENTSLLPATRLTLADYLVWLFLRSIRSAGPPSKAEGLQLDDGELASHFPKRQNWLALRYCSPLGRVRKETWLDLKIKETRPIKLKKRERAKELSAPKGLPLRGDSKCNRVRIRLKSHLRSTIRLSF